jgi:hypothetical protein
MELIEIYSCKSKKELLVREGYWVKTLNATLNDHMPGRTPKEYYEENKTHILAKHKANNEANKEHIAIQKKAYRETTKEKRAKWQSEYDKNNKERRTAWRKAHREANKESIDEKNRERITCECGATINYASKHAHKKSRRHISFMSNLQMEAASTV